MSIGLEKHSDPESVEWRSWSFREWNDVLFDHFFRIRGEDTSPVSQIVVNDEVLKQVAGETRCPAEDVGAAFRLAILRHLRGRNLVRVATSYRWGSHERPRFVIHLLATCYAATRAIDSGTEGNFRKRLNEFLDHGENKPGYDLGDLPDLWVNLRDWLDKAIEAGHSFRRLILRSQPQYRCIIGYSLDLAFPSHPDHRALVALLQPHALSLSPAIFRVVQIVERGISHFSDRFRESFCQFVNAFLQGDINLYHLPFWSAVRNAIADSAIESVSDNGKPCRTLLRLDLEEDWTFGLTIYLDRYPSRQLVDVLSIRPAEEFSVGDFNLVLAINQTSENSQSAGGLLLNGRLCDLLPELDPDLIRAVNQGLLLFEQNEDDVWIARFVLPLGDRVRALVRDDILAAVQESLQAQSPRVLIRSSRFEHWSEVHGLSRQLLDASGLALKLPEIDALQKTVEEPRISLRGGIRIPGGWLGRRCALPEIVTTPSDVDVTIALSVDGEERTCQQKVNSQSFEIPALLQRPLDDIEGKCLIRTRQFGKILMSKAVEFRSHVLSSDYRVLSSPDNWFCEGGRCDVEPLTSDQHNSEEITTNTQCDSTLIRLSVDPGQFQPDYQQGHAVESLIEILAGRSLNTCSIQQSEIIDWFQRTLQLSTFRLLWDVIRGWVECGALDVLTYRAWRGCSYVPRKPRFVVSARPGPLSVFGVLQGLTPVSIEQAIDRLAGDFGLTFERFRPVAPWLPAPLIVRASSVEPIKHISERIGLGHPQRLGTIDRCLARVRDVHLFESELRRNHQRRDYWNWESCSFTELVQSSGVIVERYCRDDAPDSYVITAPGLVPTHTFSRTWALLIAASERQIRPFAADGRSRIKRLIPGLHLPLPAGRWATASSGVSPGPTENRDYVYSFSGSTERAVVLKTLWPAELSFDVGRRAHHLDQLRRARRSNCDTMVAVPDWINGLMRENATALGCEWLGRSTCIPQRLLPQLKRLAETVRADVESSRSVK